MWRMMIAVAVSIILFASGSIAIAVPIQFSYTGTVSVAEGSPENGPFEAFLDETMLVTYTFESSSPDQNKSANGDYLDAITALEIKLGQYTYKSATGNIIIINNDVNPDQYIVDVPYGLEGPDIGEIPIARFQLIFSDNTHAFFKDDKIPVTQPEPNSFSDAAMWLTFESLMPFDEPPEKIFSEPQWGIISADGTVRIAAIPEPSTLLMLTAGAVGLICFRRKRQRDRCNQA